jgi:hypothetical protein
VGRKSLRLVTERPASERSPIRLQEIVGLLEVLRCGIPGGFVVGGWNYNYIKDPG